MKLATVWILQLPTAKWSVYCEETHCQASLTTRHSSQGSYIVWFHEKDLILQHINLNDRCLFFLSATLFRVDIKRLNKLCILTRRIKITNMQFLHFFTNLPTLLLFFFSLRHIIMLTTKCKTNLILDKTNKINSL